MIWASMKIENIHVKNSSKWGEREVDGGDNRNPKYPFI